jgi:anti-sigma regulatory factor (Ser/Thr protein kinase)
VRDLVTARGLGSLATTLELMVSELVTNAVVHGRGAVDVTVAVDGTAVHLEVHDSGAGRPTVMAGRADEAGAGGWGLSIVEQLSDDWGTVVADEGTSVWLTKRAGPDTGQP